ncbi:MAG: hypothetical protein FD143_2211 [Ignavibacteria bacterium]|nr:MAG: hypothetical protein FD143_2211 [Ignavibacteria bacterium]KAF0158686.1 MAG: hypothetical protein FD188_2493 [Ignavibacteria bacterium]
MKNKLSVLVLLVLSFSGVSFGQTPAVVPLDAATGVTQSTATFTWTDIAVGLNPNIYDFEIHTNGAYTSLLEVGQQVTGTVNAVIGTALAFNTTYYWRVRNADLNDDGVAGDNDVWVNFSFTTEIATPVLTAPTDVATNQLTSPILNWTLAGGTGGVTFDLQYYVGIGAFPGTTVTGVTAPHTLAGLGSNQTITWRIVAKKAGESDKYSSSRTFTTYTYPTPTPANAATNQNVNTLTQVSWTAINEGNAGNGPYDVEVYIGVNDGAPDFFINSTTNLFFVLTNPLLYNQLYTWRVRDTDTDGGGANGTWHQFTFTTQAIPSPVLVTPANTLTGVPILPTFSWTWAGFGAVTYRLEVSTSNAFGTTVIDTTGLTLLTLTMPEARKLANNTTYYWRVTATQGANTAISSVWSFKTIPVVSILPINPINGSVNVELSPTYFSFQVVNGFTGSLKYKVQYFAKTTVPTIAEWGGSSNFTLTNLLSELPYPVSTLLANKKYYWRVVILNSSDEVVSYSGSYFFTTKSGAFTPYLSYPIGGLPVYTNSPTFSWYIGTSDLTNLTFTLITASNAGFTVGVDSVQNIAALQYDWIVTPFAPGATRYWKVKCWYKKGISAEEQFLTSSTGSFIPQGSGTASTPFLAYPIGSTTVYTTTPTLYWYTGTSTAGVVFDVYIKLSSAGSYTKVADNTSNLFLDLSGVLLNPFTLAAGSTYNWYAVAEGGNGAFTSTVGTFIVSSSIGTGYPVASWPVGNPSVYSLTPTVYWYMYGSQTGLTKYVIKYSQTNTDLSQATWTGLGGGVDLALSETSYTIPTNLTAGLKYYWAIAGYDGVTKVTPWSTGSFTVSNTTTAVSVYLSTPIGGTTVYTLTPTLYWYATGAVSGITSYSLKYSNTSNLLGGAPPAFVTTISTGLDNFYTLPSNPALAGATIYWQVTVNYTGGSSISTTGSFVIDPGSSSVVPLAGSPINNVELRTTAATLSWFTPAPSKSKLTYSVEYSDNIDFANSKIVTGLSEPKLSVTGLKDNTTYFWRAKSLDAQGNYSKFSDIATFRTSGNLTSAEQISEIPSKFELAQNYPNPFNPSTVISYKIQAASYVTLKVYDVLGSEVATLVDEHKQPGTYNSQFSIRQTNSSRLAGAEAGGGQVLNSQLGSGVYFYRLTAGNFVSVKKMLLIK